MRHPQEAGQATGGGSQKRVLSPLPLIIQHPSCSCQLRHKVWRVKTFGLMNALHRQSVSGIRQSNGGQSVGCQWPVRGYHQR